MAHTRTLPLTTHNRVTQCPCEDPGNCLVLVSRRACRGQQQSKFSKQRQWENGNQHAYMTSGKYLQEEEKAQKEVQVKEAQSITLVQQ